MGPNRRGGANKVDYKDTSDLYEGGRATMGMGYQVIPVLATCIWCILYSCFEVMCILYTVSSFLFFVKNQKLHEFQIGSISRLR